MDLARRIRKIVADNQGVLLFVKIPQPTTGFVTLESTSSAPISSFPTPEEQADFIRNYLVLNWMYVVGEFVGFAAYRRAGRAVIGLIKWFPSQIEAENYARPRDIAWIYNMTTGSAVQIGDFEPTLPGDGVVEV